MTFVLALLLMERPVLQGADFSNTAFDVEECTLPRSQCTTTDVAGNEWKTCRKFSPSWAARLWLGLSRAAASILQVDIERCHPDQAASSLPSTCSPRIYLLYSPNTVDAFGCVGSWFVKLKA